MKEVRYTTSELQANLKQALREVGRGNTVVVTSRGRPVATITRASASTTPKGSIEARLLQLAKAGRLRLGKPGRIRPYVVPRIAGLAEQLLADRR